MDLKEKKELVGYLLQYATDNKRKKIQEVIHKRTRHVTIVLEDVFQTHNASAVVRSAECFGIQDMYVIEKRNEFKPVLGVAKGSSKWIDCHTFDNTTVCIKELKKNGYKIVATSPHKTSCFLHDLNIDNKTALLFGTEAIGLSQEALDLSDEFVTIPMFGFTESFNISVSVAICLYDVMQRLRKSSLNWQLSDKEIIDIKLQWLRKIIPGVDIIERDFFKKKSQ